MTGFVCAGLMAHSARLSRWDAAAEIRYPNPFRADQGAPPPKPHPSSRQRIRTFAVGFGRRGTADGSAGDALDPRLAYVPRSQVNLCDDFALNTPEYREGCKPIRFKKREKIITGLLTFETHEVTYAVSNGRSVKRLRSTEASASFIIGLFSVPAPSTRSDTGRRGF
jgi:hypothetical protein